MSYTGWSLKAMANKFREGISTDKDLQGSIGNINKPLLDLPLNNSLAMKQGVGSVTFTRASTATYVDRYGVVQTAANDEPRFEKEGLLIEGESTNALLYSQDFANGVWTTSGTASKTSDTELAPDGTNTACLVENADNVISNYLAHSTISGPVAGETWTASAFVKGTIGAEAALYVKRASGGAVTTESTTLTLDGSWQRIEVAITLTTDNVGIQTRYATEDGSDFTLWGAQLEELPFATSYIPTVASPETRLADTMDTSRDNNLPDLVNGTSTILIDYLAPSNIATVPLGYLFQSRVNTNDRIDLYVLNGNIILNSDTGPGIATVLDITAYATQKIRIGISFETTDNVLYVNGVEGSRTSRNGAAPMLTNNGPLKIGMDLNDASQINSDIGNFRTYAPALTPTEISLA